MDRIMTMWLVFFMPLVLAQSDLKFYSKSSSNYFPNLHEVQRLFVHEHWIARTLPGHLNAGCANDMAKYLNQLERGNVLALQINDSSGRYQGGALLINEFWLGSKTLCHEVNDLLNDIGASFNISRVHFSVTRMSIKVPPLYPTTNVLGKVNHLNVGQCLPQSCSVNDVKAIMDTDPAVLALNSKSNQTDEKNELKVLSTKLVPGAYHLYGDYKFLVACAITSCLLALVTFGTIYEVCMDLNKTKLGDDVSKSTTCQNLVAQFVLCFALGSNAKAIFTLDLPSEESFTCIHGLRTFSLIWTILGHTGLMMFTIGANRLIQFRESQQFRFQGVANGTYAVDTFFFLSSFLVVTLFLKKYKDSKVKTPMQWVAKAGLLIFYRYGRLTPVYMLILLYSELGMKFAYNQTVFPNNPDLIDHITCEKYWWRNVLYINNWYPKDEICMIWSWFLANEMQFYVMAILLLIISLKHFKTAVFMLGVFLVSSWVISASLSLSHDYKYKLILPLEAFDYLYEKPWNRVGAYIIGMITGGIFHHHRTPPKVSRALNLTLWTVSLVILFGLVFGFGVQDMSVIMTAFVVSVGRTVWSCALIWVMLSCCWGLAPTINGILSWKAWVPLSRLTYCAYLIHPLLLAICYHILDTPIPFHQITVIAVYAGTLLLTYTVALGFSLLLEAPTIRVVRLLIKK